VGEDKEEVITGIGRMEDKEDGAIGIDRGQQEQSNTNRRNLSDNGQSRL